MAETVREAMKRAGGPRFAVGRQMIDVVTSGMYSSPLMVLREYVQNAVDSIDEAIELGLLKPENGVIAVELDGRERTITVEDNGVGLGNGVAAEMLCGIGLSTKGNRHRRGFRGIGRLGGLGYCDRLCFETRRSKKDKIVEVQWDGASLRKELGEQESRQSAESALRKGVITKLRTPSAQDPPRFFRVTMHGVHRFHRDELMDPGVSAQYLARVAPVPFRRETFPFADEIDQHLCEVQGYRSYDIRLNGTNLYRPHTAVVELSKGREDTIQKIELFDVPAPSGHSIGRGWYARTQFRSSLPPRVGMRGIRVRQGNIEVGDEYFFSNMYSERRFATWHIGEVHMGYSVRVNARRDDFEQSNDYEVFLEKMSQLGRHLSHLCRTSSLKRSRVLSTEKALARAERRLEHIIVVDEEHRRALCDEIDRALAKLERLDGEGKHISRLSARLRSIKARRARLEDDLSCLADYIDGRSLRYLGSKELLTLVSRSMVKNYSSVASVEELLVRVLSPYLKRQETRST